ncbi:MAG: hypothetical protein WDN24_16235 [Sphingomonas sp.]
MPGGDGFAPAFDALERTLHDIELVARRSDAERKRDLIVQRRLLAERMTAVQQLAHAPGSPFAREPEALEFHRQFSKMRSAVALHQATWSVVLIDDAPQEYLDSSRSASDAVRAFLLWARGVLRALQPGGALRGGA